MKEFEYSLNRFLINGLRPETRARRNLPVLTEALGVRATSDGLVEPNQVNLLVFGGSYCGDVGGDKWTLNDWEESGDFYILDDYTGSSDLEHPVELVAGKIYRVYFKTALMIGSSITPKLGANVGIYHPGGVAASITVYAETIEAPEDDTTLIFTGTSGGPGDATQITDIHLENMLNSRLNKVVNGDFEIDLSSWVAGPNWAWYPLAMGQGFPGAAEYTGLGPASLVQSEPDISLVIGRTYRISYSIIGNTAPVLSYVQAFTGTTGGAQNGVPGRYVEEITCAGNTDFTITANHLGPGELLVISDVVVEEVVSPENGVPQLLRGRSQFLAADCSEVWLIDDITYILTKVEFYDFLNQANRLMITAGDIWHLADLGKGNIILTNGACMAFKINYAGMTGGTDKYLIADETGSISNTILAHRGRILTACKASTIPSATWAALYDTWATSEYDFGIDMGDDPGQYFVFWSYIGGGDFLWQLEGGSGIAENSNLPGLGYSTDWPMFLDMLYRNDAGFIPTHLHGDVYAIKTLGKNVMIYGSDGVAMLTQQMDPTPTFGYEVILEGIGIAGRGAVNGNSTEHVFVDSFGNVWKATHEGVQRLGYKEFLSDSRDSILVSFDPDENEFYIQERVAGVTGCYLLTRSGLTKVDQEVISIVRDGYYLFGAGTQPTDELDVIIERVDMSTRALKQIQHVNCSHEGIIDGVITISPKYEANGEYISGPAIPLGPEGVAFIAATAIEYKIRLTGTTDDVLIPNIDIAYSFVDSRYRRGLQVNESPENIR